MCASKEHNPNADFPLTDTSRTLLMPLWGRAKASRANSPILFDSKAVQIVERLGLDLQDFDRVLHPSNEIFAMARTRALDDLARQYIREHPKATIVNLGSGLDTGFYRVDNGLIQWFDVDVPQVIELRRKLIPEEERTRYISASLLDRDWVREIEPRSQGLFFLACGVLVYFTAPELRELFSMLMDSFPGAEMAFDMQSPLTNFFGNRRLKAAGMGAARFRWSGVSAKPIRKLNPRIEVLEVFGIFSKRSESDFPTREIWRTAKSTDRMRAMTIAHARLGA